MNGTSTTLGCGKLNNTAMVPNRKRTSVGLFIGYGHHVRGLETNRDKGVVVRLSPIPINLYARQRLRCNRPVLPAYSPNE
ncbi:MAG TPA: hypothetical protein VJ728_09110 [Candidatus Binataceae bacterium]|nr:hypothetical protein [Candidatus Binataceae bacterium]